MGYVVILVTGKAPEKFVNMAASRGIYLWEATKISEGAILLKVRLSAVKPLRHIARRTGCRFKIRARRGLPFFLARLRSRKSMVLGLALFLGSLYLLSSIIWFVEVKGNNKISQSDILIAAGDAGLKKWAPKWRVDTVLVENVIKEKFPLVSWTGVEIKGTKATIEIVERIVTEAEDKRPSHIIAHKAGLIKEVLVVNGNPAVKEGDTVTSGQVLISGAIPPPEEPLKPGEIRKPGDPPKTTGPYRFVQAKGIVRARVWYEGYGEVGVIETGVRPTGRSGARISMKFDGKEIILSGSQNIPFEQYSEETFVKKAPQWRNIYVPVEVITVKYYEMQPYRDVRGLEGARRIASEKATEEVNKQLPRDVRVLQRRLEEVHTGQPENLVRVRAVLEVVEDIGKVQYFNYGQPQ